MYIREHFTDLRHTPQNLLGNYAMLQPTLRSNIMTRAILTKLTPALPSFVPIIQTELEYGAFVEIPECRGMDPSHSYRPLFSLTSLYR
jgi:hypothetical protein